MSEENQQPPVDETDQAPPAALDVEQTPAEGEATEPVDAAAQGEAQADATEPVGDQEPPTRDEIPEPPHPQYYVTDWSGYKNYVCTVCGQGFLDGVPGSITGGRDDVLQHYWDEHEKPTAPRPGSGLILDSQGNPIY